MSQWHLLLVVQVVVAAPHSLFCHYRCVNSWLEWLTAQTHKPYAKCHICISLFWFKDSITWLYNVFEWDSLSISIIICLVSLNDESVGVFYTLGVWFLLLYAMWLPWSKLVGCNLAVSWNWGGLQFHPVRDWLSWGGYWFIWDGTCCSVWVKIIYV